jgi:butyrate kinase
MDGNESQQTIFVVNTGSTSSKLALYLESEEVASFAYRHTASALEKFNNIWEQLEHRTEIARSWLSTRAVTPSVVVGIGGLLRPVAGGTYLVNERMVADARANLQGEHASNLGCAIARNIAAENACPAFVVDPVSVDEFESLARLSGHPLIERRSLSHALNIHSVARLAAGKLGKLIEETRLIVAHLGGGISVAPVVGGKIVDANDASSDGPFSPERTGGLPLQQFIGLCYSGKYSEGEVRKLVMGKGGLSAYLGTISAHEVEDRISHGDDAAREIFEGMAYQISKEIGGMATVLKGQVNAIALTGGLAGSKILVEWIRERVEFISPVQVFPGEDEMKALALGVLRVLRGEEGIMEY